MVTDESRQWLTVGEAAKILRMSDSAVRRAVDAGNLTGGKTPGGHRRISAASVQRLYREMYPDEPENQ